MKTFTNSELSLTVTAADVDGFLAALKENGVRAGKKPLQELLDGKRDEVAGFYLVEGTVDELVMDAPLEPAAVDAAPAAETPTAAAADEKAPEGFTPDAVAAAVAEALAAGAPVITEKPAAPADAKPAVVRVKAVMKSAAPKGKIKAVRKGTKIAVGLELLLAGTTQAALAGAGIGDDPVDFVNRRVTKRGYGVALDGENVKLVLPEGVTAIAYSGS